MIAEAIALSPEEATISRKRNVPYFCRCARRKSRDIWRKAGHHVSAIAAGKQISGAWISRVRLAMSGREQNGTQPRRQLQTNEFDGNRKQPAPMRLNRSKCGRLNLRLRRLLEQRESLRPQLPRDVGGWRCSCDLCGCGKSEVEVATEEKVKQLAHRRHIDAVAGCGDRGSESDEFRTGGPNPWTKTERNQPVPIRT